MEKIDGPGPPPGNIYRRISLSGGPIAALRAAHPLPNTCSRVRGEKPIASPGGFSIRGRDGAASNHLTLGMVE
jgi:hypothetical protein